MDRKINFGESLRWAGRYRFAVMFALITGAGALVDELYHAVSALPVFMR